MRSNLDRLAFIVLNERAARHTHSLKVLSAIVGPDHAKSLMETEALLPLVLPVLRSNGTNAQAVKRLKDAVMPNPKEFRARQRHRAT